MPATNLKAKDAVQTGCKEAESRAEGAGADCGSGAASWSERRVSRSYRLTRVYLMQGAAGYGGSLESR